MFDGLMRNHDRRYFQGWTDEDYRSAFDVIGACPNAGYTPWFNYRLRYIADLRKQVAAEIAAKEKARQAAVEAQQAAQVAADRERARQAMEFERQQAQARADAQRQEAEIQRERFAEARISACHQSQQYRLFIAENRIWRDLRAKKAAQKILEQDDKIGAVSGATNLSARYAAGAEITAADEDIQQIWPEYKAAGGEAETSVFVDGQPNPCR